MGGMTGEYHQEGHHQQGQFLEELSGWELEAGVIEGLFVKVDDHEEHFAIDPYWLSQPKQGILQELTKTLGKWNNKLQAYPVGFEKMRAQSSVADMNEDHRWLHVNVLVTYFLYKPEEGQQLKGIIRKIGHKAAICTTFNVFSATVYPQSEFEQSEWAIGQEVVFTVTFVQNRRRGPFIKGDSIGTVGSTTPFTVSKGDNQKSPVKGKSKKFSEEDENWEVMDITGDKSSLEKSMKDEAEDEWGEYQSQSPKKKKKKDKRRKKSDEAEVIEIDGDSQVNIDNGVNLEDDDIQEIPPPKKKKKKRKHSDE